MDASKECKTFIRPVRDVLELINGKWKLPVLIALSFGTKRFKELERDIVGITPRMLSKELKDLEANKLIQRKTNDGVPMVEYTLTDYGQSLDSVIASIREWGLNHRRTVFDNN